MTKSLETLINGQGNDLNLPSNLMLFTVLFLASPIPGSLPYSPTSAFVFRLRWYLRGWRGPFWGVTPFSWVSPLFTGIRHVITFLFVLLLLIYLLL